MTVTIFFNGIFCFVWTECNFMLVDCFRWTKSGWWILLLYIVATLGMLTLLTVDICQKDLESITGMKMVQFFSYHEDYHWAALFYGACVGHFITSALFDTSNVSHLNRFCDYSRSVESFSSQRIIINFLRHNLIGVIKKICFWLCNLESMMVAPWLDVLSVISTHILECFLHGVKGFYPG